MWTNGNYVLGPLSFSPLDSSDFLLLCCIAGVGTLCDGSGFLYVCHLPHAGYRVENADEPNNNVHIMSE